jgi:hypothetical protein
VDHGVDELWVADEPIGYTLLPDSDLMLGIESRPTEPRRRSPLQPTC